MMQGKLPISAFLLIAAAAAIAVIGMNNFSALEKEVFERLMIAFGETEAMLKSGSKSGAARDVLLWLFSLLLSAAGLVSGWKLSAVPRIVVSIQVFVLSLVITWAAWKYLSIALPPVTFIAAITLGVSLGYALRRWHADETRMQSQFYLLKLRNNELRDVRLQMVRQDEVERRMLAADLHDQVLNDMKRFRKRFEAYAKDRATGDATEQKEEIDKILSDTMVEIREVMDSLCPSALEHLGLSAALEDCARKAGEKGGFKARCKSKIEDADVEKLSLVEQSLLYRLVQEALTNVIKHAEAKTVRINSEMSGDNLVVTVADDGKGIPDGKLSEDSRGLRYMRQRADLIGATISFRAGDGMAGPGTIVEIRVDLAGRTAVENSGG
jgi:signal transduction histidine kinase